MKKVRKVHKAVKTVPEPQVEPVSLPLALPKRGRPSKKDALAKARPSVNPEPIAEEDIKQAKALTMFRRAIGEAEKLLMTPEGFDGGGTQQDAHSVTKESLQRRVTRRLNVLDRFLTDDKLIELLALSSLKEIGIYEGILLDKSLVLQGQPNVIIGNDDRASMAAVLPRLMQELHRRKLIASTSQTVSAG